MNGSHKIVLAAISAVMMLSALPALADNDDRGRRHDERGWHPHEETRGNHHTNDHYENERINHHYQRNIGRPEVVRIYDQDRAILTQYVQDNYKRNASWGRSKKYHRYPSYEYTPRNYLIGAPLPHRVRYYSVPYEIRSHLRPTPIGYEYIRVDDDVLLMHSSSKNIIDAVTLFTSFIQR